MTEIYDEIELSIIKELNDFISDAHAYTGNKLWTKRIKERIGNLGRRFKYQIASAGCDEDFERDGYMIWYVEDVEGRLKRIPLIMESEWDYNYAGIKYDFEKLLVGKADNRLLICQSRPNEIDLIFQKLKNAIDVFEGNYGDKFMIAVLEYNNYVYKFHYQSYSKSNPDNILKEYNTIL